MEPLYSVELERGPPSGTSFMCTALYLTLCVHVCVSACLQEESGDTVNPCLPLSLQTVFDNRHLIFLSRFTTHARTGAPTYTRSLVSVTCPEAEQQRLTQMCHRCQFPC